MIFTKLQTEEEFEALKKGDILIVKWDEKSTDSKNKPIGPITATKVYKTLIHIREIVLNMPNNVYFKYDLYLKGTSHAKEVYKVTDEEVHPCQT